MQLVRAWFVERDRRARWWTQVLPCYAGGKPPRAQLADWLVSSAGVVQEAHVSVGHYEYAGFCIGLKRW